jgi:Transmembrane secretion effector
MWIASLLSNFGTLIQGVGAAWLMTSLAPSADMVALVQVSTVLPIMLQKELRHSLLLQSRAGQAELRFEVELPQESGAAPVGETEHQS